MLRQPEHVMLFLLAEMGTSGLLDGHQRLVINGRFVPKKIEAILRRHISKLSNFIVSMLSSFI
jgi:translation initiation factor 2 subunit 2